MKISLLITYYQQERFVRESMESLLALKKPEEWEILIGDDGSTDGTVAAAQSYVDRDPEHIRLFIMDRDPSRKYTAVERAGKNRLNLLRHASGDCYCLLDGDDFYSETDFLPQALSILKEHPEVTIVAFDTWMYREGQPRTPKRAGKREPVFLHRRKYLRWQYTHAGACVYRNFHGPENFALLDRLDFFDDNEIILNAMAAGKMVRIHLPVYAYRQEDVSLYHSILPGERAALNVAGMGIALQIMGPSWAKDLKARYATAVVMAWMLRKNLRSQVPPDRFRTYLEICRRGEFDMGEQLLCFPDQKPDIQRRIRKWVFQVALESPPRILFAWFQIHRKPKAIPAESSA